MNRNGIDDQNNDNIIDEPQDILKEDEDDDNNENVVHILKGPFFAILRKNWLLNFFLLQISNPIRAGGVGRIFPPRRVFLHKQTLGSSISKLKLVHPCRLFLTPHESCQTARFVIDF